jgi:lipopolysaccharide biosynthesis glycosyltransferase
LEANPLKSHLDILASINRRYVPPLKALLHSIYLNNAQSEVCVHLLHTELREEDVGALADTARRYGGELVPYRVSEEHRKLSDQSKIFPPEIFYRLLATEYLPETVRRALYLDGDTIVNGPLESLFNLDLTDGGKRCSFAAATDPNNGTVDSVFRKQRLGLPLEAEYVNTGVLLIDLARLRESGAVPEILKQIPYYGATAVLPDQDLLNVLFQNQILHIDPYTYNYFPASSHSRLHEFRTGYPAVIHYAGIKPWKAFYPTQNEFTQKAKALYDFYAAL